MYIGIDLHKGNAVVTALDVDGREVLTTKIKNTKSGWEEFHELFPDGGQVVLESTLNHMGVVDLLEGWGYTVSVAHSKDVHAIAMSKSKTDKIDSRILAKLLQSDFLSYYQTIGTFGFVCLPVALPVGALSSASAARRLQTLFSLPSIPITHEDTACAQRGIRG
ncbi:MAG: transposase [Candidatus Thermoplasmatota archaeon]